MILTVGASLQHSKYEIQDILNLSGMGATYKATHAYLDQPVILQTFNEVAQQRNDFEQLKQQFKQKVQSLAKQPAPAIRILDCFEENTLPFVVLPFVPNQPSPKLSDWFSVASPQTASASMTATPDDAFLEAALDVGTATASTATATSTLVAATSVAEATTATSTAQPLTGNKPRSHQSRLYTSAKRRLPSALMAASLIGGFVGAGMGLALRIAALPQENGKAALSFFDRDQNFPPEGSWPIRERAVYIPEPAVEQPLYRTTPFSEYTAPIQTLPSESYQPYLPPTSPEETDPYAEEPSEPTTSLPSDTAPKSSVELPPDVDSLYTDEWIPSIESLPPDVYTAPVEPLPSDSVLPPQSNRPVPPPSKKRASSGSLRIVNQ